MAMELIVGIIIAIMTILCCMAYVFWICIRWLPQPCNSATLILINWSEYTPLFPMSHSGTTTTHTICLRRSFIRTISFSFPFIHSFIHSLSLIMATANTFIVHVFEMNDTGGDSRRHLPQNRKRDRPHREKSVLVKSRERSNKWMRHRMPQKTVQISRNDVKKMKIFFASSWWMCQKCVQMKLFFVDRWIGANGGNWVDTVDRTIK